MHGQFVRVAEFSFLRVCTCAVFINKGKAARQDAIPIQRKSIFENSTLTFEMHVKNVSLWTSTDGRHTRKRSMLRLFFFLASQYAGLVEQTPTARSYSTSLKQG